jgi:hypothetical protein
VLLWVAHPAVASEPTEILREHPHAAPSWHGLLQGRALQGRPSKRRRRGGERHPACESACDPSGMGRTRVS